MPIVYILTNECMPETIKIGVTENLEQRMKQLDNTSVALPFECYYAVEVPDTSAIEKKMHQGLDDCRVRNNREFFRTAAEQAKSILEIAEIMGGKDVTPKEDIVKIPQDLEALQKARTVRKRFNFQMLDIEKGTVLQFKKDKSITCEVFDDSKVKFRDEVISLSRSASIVLQEMGYDWGGAARGTIWWCLDGKTLYQLRNESEG